MVSRTYFLLLILNFLCCTDKTTKTKELFYPYNTKAEEEIGLCEYYVKFPDTKDSCPFYGLIDVAQNETGEIIVSDISENRICVFDSFRKLKHSFGRKGQGPGEFKFLGIGPVEITPHHDILVYDSGNLRIQRFTKEGDFINSFIPSMSLSDMEVDKDGNIYAAYFPFSPVKIEVYSPEYKRLLRVTATQDEIIDITRAKFPFPSRQIAVDSEMNIYVNTTDNFFVEKYNRKGQLLLRFGRQVETKKFAGTEIARKMESQSSQLKGRMKERLSPVRDIMISPNDEIYVNYGSNITESPSDSISIVDVFSSSGVYIKKYKLINAPYRFKLEKSHSFYGIFPDSTGWKIGKGKIHISPR